MDEFEDLDVQNFTNLTYYYYEANSGLTTWQIVDLLWSLICLVPNVILVYLIVKNNLQRNNFHLIILHCTIISLILLMLVIYLSIIPDMYRSFVGDEVVLSLDATFRMVPVILTTLYVYDKYIKSEIVCFHSVIFIWVFIAILSIVEIICISSEYYYIFYVYPIIALLKLLSVLSLIIKSIVFCVVGSDEETCKLRMIIAAVYIILNCVQWFYSHVMETFIFPSAPIPITIRCALIALFYGIGYINLALLVRYDPPIKRYFRQLFGNQVQYFDIKFSRKKSDVGYVIKNDHLDTVIINS